MSIFTYEAYNSEGGIVRGEYDGNKREDVVDHLTKRDLTPISIEMLHAVGEKKSILDTELFGRISKVDVMFLVRNLATTTKAGLSIIESLSILIADAENKMMQRILREVQAMVMNGQQLSRAFEAYADSFPPIFLGMLRAGEISGQLDKSLSQLGVYLSKEYALRSKVKSALTYPIILLVASTGVVAMLLMFVLPRLTKAFTSSGVKLPWVTKFFLTLSNALTWSFLLDFVILAFLVWFTLYFRTTKTGKRFFFWVISHTPVAKELVKRVALVRFSRTLGNLMGSGISALESLELSAQSVANEKYTAAIENAITDIKNGVSISDSLGKYPDLFPRLLVSLIVVGERTGTLHEILNTFADFYEEEVDNALKDLTAFIEPALLLVMGLLVGAIAVSIILPIYQLVGHFT